MKFSNLECCVYLSAGINAGFPPDSTIFSKALIMGMSSSELGSPNLDLAPGEGCLLHGIKLKSVFIKLSKVSNIKISVLLIFSV